MSGNTIYKKRGGLNMKISEFHDSKPAWISKSRQSWNIVTFVAYFCKKYEDLYGTRYIFSRWTGNPALTKEGRDFSRILKRFESQGLEKIDAKNKLYNLINWAFDFKGKRGTSINSSGLLDNHVFLNEFEKMYSKYLNKKNNQSGMKELVSWCESANPDILSSYDLKNEKDLDFIKKMVESFDMEGSPEFILIEKAKSMGLI